MLTRTKRNKKKHEILDPTSSYTEMQTKKKERLTK